MPFLGRLICKKELLLRVPRRNLPCKFDLVTSTIYVWSCSSFSQYLKISQSSSSSYAVGSETWLRYDKAAVYRRCWQCRQIPNDSLMHGSRLLTMYSIVLENTTGAKRYGTRCLHQTFRNKSPAVGVREEQRNTKRITHHQNQYAIQGKYHVRWTDAYACLRLTGDNKNIATPITAGTGLISDSVLPKSTSLGAASKSHAATPRLEQRPMAWHAMCFDNWCQLTVFQVADVCFARISQFRNNRMMCPWKTGLLTKGNPRTSIQVRTQQLSSNPTVSPWRFARDTSPWASSSGLQGTRDREGYPCRSTCWPLQPKTQGPRPSPPCQTGMAARGVLTSGASGSPEASPTAQEFGRSPHLTAQSSAAKRGHDRRFALCPFGALMSPLVPSFGSSN
ncbi:Uncharacterized protein LW93_10871 [Fusarium fujikuroi]|nr:Uncharacterized protein LW93_10871 [Fusarium fujikuroi]